MKKKIAKVRKRISNRRKLTFSDYPYQKKHDFHHVNLEEKHGFSPHTLYTSGKKPSSKMYRKTIVKGVTRLFLAFAFFLVIYMIMLPESMFSEQIKEKTFQALTEDFPFVQAYMWYEERFGLPLSFVSQIPEQPVENTDFALPVVGEVIDSPQMDKTGIYIIPEKRSNVRSMTDGVVVFAAEIEKRIKKQLSFNIKTKVKHLIKIYIQLMFIYINLSDKTK